MATIANSADLHNDHTAYHLVRRAQATIAGYRHYDEGDLSRYLARDSFQGMANRLAEHYFHKSKGLALHEQVQELYLSLLVMAPILQRLPLSAKFDWHRGHLASFFRVNVNGTAKRYHFASRVVERGYQPEDLVTNLDLLGIHDSQMVAVVLDLYRRHAAGTALKDLLACQLFDPVLLRTQKQGFELRFGNCLYRIEKTPFPGSVDLRRESAIVLDYQITSCEHVGGRHLEIMIAAPTLATFRRDVKGILSSSANPARKIMLLDGRIRDFVERTRWARSAKPQIDELRVWISDKLRPLAGTLPQARHLANLLPALWCQRSEHRLFMKRPNFFLQSREVDEKTFLCFFSPYREVS